MLTTRELASLARPGRPFGRDLPMSSDIAMSMPWLAAVTIRRAWRCGAWTAHAEYTRSRCWIVMNACTRAHSPPRGVWTKLRAGKCHCGRASRTNVRRRLFNPPPHAGEGLFCGRHRAIVVFCERSPCGRLGSAGSVRAPDLICRRALQGQLLPTHQRTNPRIAAAILTGSLTVHMRVTSSPRSASASSAQVR